MATAPKFSPQEPKFSEDRGDAQLKKDRLIGLVALVIIAALMLFMIWLASLGEAPAGMDSMPFMP